MKISDFETKPAFLLDKMYEHGIFVTPTVLDYHEEDYSGLCFYMLEAFDKVFIALVEDHFDTPNIVAMDADGELYCSSNPMINVVSCPTLDLQGECWYHGDEAILVHRDLRKYAEEHIKQKWYNIICEPTVMVLNIKSNEAKILAAKLIKEQSNAE